MSTSAISSDISSLIPSQSSTGYTATASIGSDGTVDASTSTVTGDRTAAGWSTGTDGSSGTNTLGQSDFLNLLMAEMENQDPLNPTDDSQFMQQLTSMQQVQSSENILTAIQGLDTDLKSSATSQQNSATSVSDSSAVSLIGKEVRIKQSTVTYDGTETQVPIYVNLGDNATSATVQIEDSSGKVVRSLTAGNKDSQNSSEVDWDGKSDQGTAVSPGTYTVNIVGSDTNSDLYAFVQNTVDGVQFTGTGAMLTVAGQQLPISNVMSVVPAASSSSTFGNLSSESALSLLGKTVRVAGNVITSPATAGESIPITINGAENGLPATAQVAVYDASGNMVDILPTPDANGATSWDGKIMGTQDLAPAGSYAVVVTGVNNSPNVYPYVQGTVDSISTVSGVTEAKINGQYYPLSQILEVGTGS